MKNVRRGMGFGRGIGYYNLAPMDSHIHALSAKGVKTKYLVIYKNDNSLEGYVNNKKDFKSWLSKHNKKRKQDGEIPEKDFEFELKSIENMHKLDAKENVNPEELERELAGFTGTEQYHKLSMLPIKSTDGVAHLATKANAFWLVDAVASYQGEAKFRANQEFQIWILKKDPEGHGATLSAYRDYSQKNPNQFKPLVTQKIEYTDFPLKEIKLYYQNGVLLLPSEY